ncbi:hypothetical protein CEV32_1102 [Brucella rhizosphaerae]|uniref:Uncharacterized protein n=1 Tax=Brucella rhizosphaerae TaxID=571254 RepID=A0A256FDI0_9HYPH|nr:hypothetical protein CEV32_1102 [Brucella rhizosphaerae]
MYQPPESENLSTMNIKAFDIGRRLFSWARFQSDPKAIRPYFRDAVLFS